MKISGFGRRKPEGFSGKADRLILPQSAIDSPVRHRLAQALEAFIDFQNINGGFTLREFPRDVAQCLAAYDYGGLISERGHCALFSKFADNGEQIGCMDAGLGMIGALNVQKALRQARSLWDEEDFKRQFDAGEDGQTIVAEKLAPFDAIAQMEFAVINVACANWVKYCPLTMIVPDNGYQQAMQSFAESNPRREQRSMEKAAMKESVFGTEEDIAQRVAALARKIAEKNRGA